ncbi:MAG: peptidoglycan bridge formation glycyltransferase FemA/FemB family protein [Microbacteriaceae bacterium]
MSVRRASTAELSNWLQHVSENPDGGNVLQLTQFAAVKELSGWKAEYLIWQDRLAILALSRSIPFLGKIWYLPKGPGLTNVDEMAAFIPELKTFAREQGVFLLKVEPEILRDQDGVVAQSMKGFGLTKAADIQAASTVIVNLEPPIDKVFSAFPQPGRYAINRAKRDEGIAIAVDTTPETIDIAYRMLAETAAAGGFRIRPKDYYELFWGGYSAAGLGQMFFAKHGEQVIAIAYVIVLGEKASYKDGASVKERPVYGASHLLQWQAMQWAKEQGALSYDLTGAPPSEQLHNNEHPLHGLVSFKTSFNKQVTDYVGVYDLVLNARSKKLWDQIGYRLARRVHNRKRNEVYW